MKSERLLVRLDDTVAKENLAIIIMSLDELAARQACLEAERDDAAFLVFPRDLMNRAGRRDVLQIVHGESRLFELRQTVRVGQKSQLRERVKQLDEELKGAAEQVQAKAGEIELTKRELEGVRQLCDRKLIPISRLMALEREAVRLGGERGQLIAGMAQLRGKMAETELQIIQIDQKLRSEVAKELRESQAKAAEQEERKIAAEDQFKRIDIRAPQDGTVHQLAVHTVGGVVNAGEPLMFIVPEQDSLMVEAKVPQQNIDQLALGQRAVLRFAAFNQRTTPEIDGTLTRIGTDLTHDDKTGISFYNVRVGMSAQEIAKLNGLKLIPGMPVEAFIQTDSRTVSSYLVKPLRDQIVKAFRER